MDMRR